MLVGASPASPLPVRLPDPTPVPVPSAAMAPVWIRKHLDLHPHADALGDVEGEGNVDAVGVVSRRARFVCLLHNYAKVRL